MNLSKQVVGFARVAGTGTLDGVRSFLATSLEWTAGRLNELATIPLVEANSPLARQIQDMSAGLREAAGATEAALAQAISATGDGMQVALDALHEADEAVRRALFENISVSSIIGESFGGVITTSEIQPSFRLNGRDVDAATILRDWRESKCEHAVLCVPGLFCDESMWAASGEPSLLEVMRAEHYYPIFVRFNPGAHVSTNGQALLALMEELLQIASVRERPASSRLVAITYSQGGLILRSALYYGRLRQALFPGALDHALFVASPDGGSYIEKLGFWLGLGLVITPIAPLRLLGMIGDQRSDAMKDLSHGVIREEDWKNLDHPQRYGADLYFGELDDIEATQIYGIVSNSANPWASWIGDGIVEEPSLKLLSDRVYRKKSNPEERVHVLVGRSHFQVLPAPETREVFQKILRKV